MSTRIVLSLTLLCAACATHAKYIPGTHVPATDQNNQILDTVEQYRIAVEQGDAAALISMASKDYWEDAGTPKGDDDYGFPGLKAVLAGRFKRADGIRYSLKYMGLKVKGNLAYVDVLIDASYSIKTAKGEQRRDMKDQNELVLEWDGNRWLFVSGM